MNSRFALIHKKGTGTKMAEKLNNFEKFERKKKKIKFHPCSQPRDLLMTSQMPWTTQQQVWLLMNTQNLEKQVKLCYLVRGCPIRKSHCDNWVYLFTKKRALSFLLIVADKCNLYTKYSNNNYENFSFQPGLIRQYVQCTYSNEHIAQRGY